MKVCPACSRIVFDHQLRPNGTCGQCQTVPMPKEKPPEFSDAQWAAVKDEDATTCR